MHMGDELSLGRFLAHRRRMLGITQEKLAERLGVSKSAIAKWETEESSPDLEMARRLASALDVSLDDLANAPPDELDGRTGMRGKHMFGMVTVGDKGQIVIPVRARRVFNINPGDQLLVLGDEDRGGLALMDARFFMSVAEGIRDGL